MNKIIVFLVLLIYLKWVVFILLLPFIKVWFVINYRKTFRKKNTIQNPITNTERKSAKIIRKNVVRIIQGYLRYMDFQIGLIPSHFIRKMIYKHIYSVKLEKNSTVYWGAEIRSPYKLVIGTGSIIGDKAILDARNQIIIGNHVNLSSNVHIYTEHHDHRDPMFRSNSNESFRVKIDDRVWVGPNVTILHSVHIGEGSVVAAGSVVTKDIEPYSIVAGIPAKKIGERIKNLKYKFDGQHLPFY